MIPYHPSPIPIKDRISTVWVEKGRVDVLDGSFVVIDVHGVREHIPVGGTTCILLQPGTRISHAAIHLAALVGCLVLWVSDGGTRLYSAGLPGGSRSDRLLYQAKCVLDDRARLQIVREMFQLRFGEEAPRNRSIDQLRGIEGARVKALYKSMANKAGINWNGRSYQYKNIGASDRANQCLTTANTCLYGIVEAAILICGYSPALGYLHTGDPRAFVFDIADIVKFETVVPLAFRVAASKSYLHQDCARATRIACRDSFRSGKILDRLIPMIDQILLASGIPFREGQVLAGQALVGDPTNEKTGKDHTILLFDEEAPYGGDPE